MISFENTQNSERFKNFLEILLNRGNLNVIEKQQEIIDDYLKANTPVKFHDFIEHKDLLRFCEKKNIQEHNNEILVIKRTKATSFFHLHCYKYDLEARQHFQSKGLNSWFGDIYNCTVVEDTRGDSWVIYIKYSKDKMCEIQLFHRNPEKYDFAKNFLSLAQKHGLEWNDSKDIKRFCAYNLDFNDMLTRVENLAIDLQQL